MRLVTRGDLDGVTASVLLSEVEPIDAIELIHPQDITDGKFPILPGDIMANLPFHPAAALWFDHHELTASNRRPPDDYRGCHRIAPSVARVIYDHYGGAERFGRFEELVRETDRFDSANLTRHDVMNPQGVILLGFTVDARTGLGAFKEYFLEVVEALRRMPVAEVLRQPAVAERVALLRENDQRFLDLLKSHSRQEGPVVITDFRDLERPPVGNRFLVYALFPDAGVSLRLQWGPKRETVAATLGHNIFNRTSRVDCGRVCSDYGGGGHRGAAACPLERESADRLIPEIVARLRREN